MLLCSNVSHKCSNKDKRIVTELGYKDEELMDRIAFIIAYFGRFNNYFQIFLNSCASNKDMCDWLIFTDDYTLYDYPSNVKVTYMTWDEMKKLIRYKIDCPVRIDRPYKLCDYKPAYGRIFSEYLKGYRFWGECDCDLIWGRFSHFLTNDILISYDKIFDLGHCTIYRNSPEMNNFFMRPLHDKERYKEVYGTSDNCSFDEEYNGSINNIVLESRIKMFDKSFAANIYTKSSNFKLTSMNSDKRNYSVEKKSDSFFVWDEEGIIRYKKDQSGLRKEEFLYIHFQSRPMKVQTFKDSKKIKIIPNSFDELEVNEVDEITFSKVKKKHFNLHYLKLRSSNMIKKIKRRLRK